MLNECSVGYKCNSHFDHSWELTLQLPYFVGNIFSNQARDPNEKLSMEMHSRA